MKVSRQYSYLVLKAFRFAGRNFEPGSVFNARRLDPRIRKLQQWVDDGVLGAFDPEGEQEPEEVEAEEEVSDFEWDQEDDGVSPF